VGLTLHQNGHISDRTAFLKAKHVVTSHRLNPHPFNDFFYGGATTQIEHHLFPEIPVNKMADARKFVKSFCLSKGIPYHEVSVIQAYQEVLQSLRIITS
jgi:fatty acid desaturase